MAGWGSLSKLTRPRSFGKLVKPVAEGVGGVIGKTDGHKLMGNRVIMPSPAYNNQVIRTQNAAKISATSRSNQVFVGNRHPGLSPGVEDFTGLDVPKEALDWFEGGGRSEFLNNTFLNIGTKKKPNYITFQDLINQYEAKPTTALKNKIDGYKSGVATPWAKDADDSIVYQRGGPSALTEELKHTNPELYSAQLDKSLEFHHKSMKAVEYEIFKKMDELIESGDATVIDLINLHNLGKQFGIEAGSRKGAGLWMHRGPHNWMHKGRTKPLGIEPLTTPEASGSLGRKGSISKMKAPPKGWKETFSEAEWQKIRKSGATTSYDLEEIANWKKNLGIDGSIKRFKKLKAKGKTYTPDGKSEMERLFEEIRAINNPADLTQFRKEFLEGSSVPMTKEADIIEAAAQKQSPMFLHDTQKWGQRGMGPDLDEMRLKEIEFQREDYDYKMDRARSGKGPWPEGEPPADPEFEELLPYQLK